MKLFAAGMVAAGMMALPAFAEPVNITIEHGKSSREYSVKAGESRVFDNIKKWISPPTSGDCSAYDNLGRLLGREAKDGRRTGAERIPGDRRRRHRFTGIREPSVRETQPLPVHGALHDQQFDQRPPVIQPIGSIPAQKGRATTAYQRCPPI